MITAYNVVIIRSYFSSIPFSVIESARIDGATDYRILFQLVIPLSKPVLATVALWLIVGHWNDYLNPLVLIHSQEHKTLQLFLKELVLNAETSTSNLASVNDATNKGVAALSQQLKNGVLVVSMVPMLVAVSLPAEVLRVRRHAGLREGLTCTATLVLTSVKALRRKNKRRNYA